MPLPVDPFAEIDAAIVAGIAARTADIQFQISEILAGLAPLDEDRIKTALSNLFNVPVV